MMHLLKVGEGSIRCIKCDLLFPSFKYLPNIRARGNYIRYPGTVETSVYNKKHTICKVSYEEHQLRELLK